MTNKDIPMERGALHESQIEFVKQAGGIRNIVLRAGRRWGKTYTMAEIMKVVALDRPADITHKGIKTGKTYNDINILYVAPTIGDARGIIEADLTEIFESIPGARVIKSPFHVKGVNNFGARYYIGISGWREIDNAVRGRAFDYVFIDEADSLPNLIDAIHEVISPTFGTREGRLFVTGTPKRNRPNLKTLKDIYEGDPEWGFYQYTSYDSPLTPPEELDKKREIIGEDMFNSEYLAIYGDLGKVLFSSDIIADMFRIPPGSELDGMRWMAVDPAGEGQDKTIITVLINGMIESFESDPLNIEENIVKYMERFNISKEHLIGDATGVGTHLFTRDRFQNSMRKFNGTSKPIPDQLSLTRDNDKYTQSDFQNLRAQAYYYLSVMMQKGIISYKNVSTDDKHDITIALENTNIIDGDVDLNDNTPKKILVTPKSTIKTALKGKSPDRADTLAMLAYFYIQHITGTLKAGHKKKDWSNYKKPKKYRVK